MGNWLDTECLEGGALTVYVVEDESGVCGIYGDEDWACRRADMDSRDSESLMTVRRVTYRAEFAVEVHRAEP
jgi:hypothetical protein